MVDNLKQEMEMGQHIVTLGLVSFNKWLMFHLTCAVRTGTPEYSVRVPATVTQETRHFIDISHSGCE
jgi:hypothetical protein